MEIFNRAAGVSPVQRLGFVMAIVCLVIAAIWIVDVHSYDPGRGIEDALKAAWPGSYASSEVPIAWASKGFFLGIAMRYLALPVSRWVMRKPVEESRLEGLHAKQKPTKAISTKSGVGGWLALLVVGMTVLGPIASYGRLSGDFIDTEKLYPALLDLPAWVTYKMWTWGVWSASILTSIAGGARLAMGEDIGAVSFAKLSLWVSGPLAAVLMGIVLPAFHFGSAGFDAGAVGSTVASFFAATIWTLYLSRSQRVKNTYRRRLSSD